MTVCEINQYHSDWLFYYEGQTEKKWSDSQLTGRSYERKDQPFWGTYPKFNTVEKKEVFENTGLFWTSC